MLMLRRHPEAIVLAHTMDRSRRELYVEGPRDRLFLSWLLGASLHPEVSVREIAFVDIPNVGAGGERARLISFAEWLGDRDVLIRFFADADWDRVLKRIVPARVWLTDYRDMEGYVLRIECIDKVLRLGLATETMSAMEILKIVRTECRRLGLLRLMAELDSLALPFQAARLGRHITNKGNSIFVNLDSYLRALMQNAGLSLGRFVEIRARLQELGTEYASAPDSELIHGKDAITIIEEVLSKYGVKREEGVRLLWTSFEASLVEQGSTLETVNRFLRGG